MDYTGLSIRDVQQGDYRDRVIHPEDFKRVREDIVLTTREGQAIISAAMAKAMRWFGQIGLASEGFTWPNTK